MWRVSVYIGDGCCSWTMKNEQYEAELVFFFSCVFCVRRVRYLIFNVYALLWSRTNIDHSILWHIFLLIHFSSRPLCTITLFFFCSLQERSQDFFRAIVMHDETATFLHSKFIWMNLIDHFQFEQEKKNCSFLRNLLHHFFLCRFKWFEQTKCHIYIWSRI